MVSTWGIRGHFRASGGCERAAETAVGGGGETADRRTDVGNRGISGTGGAGAWCECQPGVSVAQAVSAKAAGSGAGGPAFELVLNFRVAHLSRRVTGGAFDFGSSLQIARHDRRRQFTRNLFHIRCVWPGHPDKFPVYAERELRLRRERYVKRILQGRVWV